MSEVETAGNHGRNLQAVKATSNFREEAVFIPSASMVKGVYSPPDDGYLK